MVGIRLCLKYRSSTSLVARIHDDNKNSFLRFCFFLSTRVLLCFSVLYHVLFVYGIYRKGKKIKKRKSDKRVWFSLFILTFYIVLLCCLRFGFFGKIYPPCKFSFFSVNINLTLHNCAKFRAGVINFTFCALAKRFSFRIIIGFGFRWIIPQGHKPGSVWGFSKKCIIIGFWSFLKPAQIPASKKCPSIWSQDMVFHYLVKNDKNLSCLCLLTKNVWKYVR